ncbi:MAG: glycerol kinase GlpK [Anaerolineales bacterium]|nr:glycerol kinase GlpK [Anaerolineales bacterium]
MADYVAAIDQGTTSTRCMLFGRDGSVRAVAQKEHPQIMPQPGWVEHDPLGIWDQTQAVIRAALNSAALTAADLAAIGITNQRETTILWDRSTGKPVYNAIVWQDTRTKPLIDTLAKEGGPDRFRSITGLPLATYFSASKAKWILDEAEGARQAAERGDLCFGTVDSWLIWWLTGGPKGGVHVTDITNASRTMLLDLETLTWDSGMLEVFGIPAAILPEIVPSSAMAPWGFTLPSGPFNGSVPVCGALGDQQAALVGQACFRPGEAKNTYGTGCFMLLNTGEAMVPSNSGLLTTAAYQFGDAAPVYALEGSIAFTGALVQWLRDNLGMIDSAPEIETLATSVADNGGVYFVPAFSGLFAPHWRPDARGIIAGLTSYVTSGHLARAVLEATAFQTREVLDAMNRDSGVSLQSLKVDGGMVRNNLLMQFQADILAVPVVRPEVAETTSLGAAYAAGLAVGLWRGLDDLAKNWKMDRTWTPNMDEEQRSRHLRAWQKAVERSLDWVE